MAVPPNIIFADYAPINAKDSRFDAKGDGATDDTAALQAAFDFCFGPVSAPHGTAGIYQNKALYIPPGHYKISAPLTGKYWHGVRIIGAGRFTTHIEQTTSSASVIVTNGCGYSRFEAMRLTAGAGGKCFDLDWDGSPGGAALQGNTFCRHALRQRRDRCRDRPLRVYGQREPVSRLPLAEPDNCGLADVESERATAERDRRKLPGMQPRHLRGRRVGADRQWRRFLGLDRLRHLHRHAVRQRHEHTGLPQ